MFSSTRFSQEVRPSRHPCVDDAGRILRQNRSVFAFLLGLTSRHQCCYADRQDERLPGGLQMVLLSALKCLAHLCFDPDLLSACLLAPAGISAKPGQSLAASRGPSSLSRASLLHRHDGKTSKQFIQAALNSFLSSETFLLSGSRIHFSFHFRLVGSRIVSGNFKWLSCVYSAVISVHSGSLVAFFVTQLSFSLV